MAVPLPGITYLGATCTTGSYATLAPGTSAGTKFWYDGSYE